MRRTRAKLCHAVLAAGVAAAITPIACAQIATLDKGHQLLVNSGLQIWGAATDTSYGLNYTSLENANMNGVIWGFPAVGGTDMNALGPGDKWGKWTDWQYNNNPANGPIVTPQNALTASEQAHFSDLIAVQVGDESNQSDMESGTQTRDWLLAAGNGTATAADDVFPNSLLYVNSFFIGNHAGYANFLTNGNPDAISWDSYPFANPHGAYILPKNWLSLGNIFRRHGLGTYIGATGASPRPYGLFVQTFHDSLAVDPGEVEIRWQQFAAWTMGYKFVDAFIYSGGNNNFGNNPAGPVYQAFQETARQGRNLGPALTRLISYGYGPSFVQGAGSSGIPGDWIFFDRNNAQPSQRYLTGISNVTNLGTKNSGLSGDVYVGFFNPLHLSFGDPAGTTYFMIMNGLGGDLALPNGQSDNTATVAETRQQMTLSFDFSVTGINSLLRLSRNTGLVEVINTSYSDGGNTVFTSLGNGKYQLQLKLDGGTGDLFKYNDGTPFVGVQAAVPLGYWDNDGNAANNNVASGAGMGGSGNWDAASSKWYNGSSNSVYAAGSNVVFAGTAGTVTLASPQSVTSLQFKTSGYTVAGSTLTLDAPTITVDAGVTATISSVVAGSAGLVKNGPGTLNLAANNSYTGGTTINEGVLGIVSGSLGATPSSPVFNIGINNGATLRFNVNNLTLSANRSIVLGSGSGSIIDTNGNNDTIAGAISGGTLTKTGAGALTLAGTNSHAATTINGGATVVASDASLGAAPASFTAGNITLDGGTLQFGAAFDINNNRGITVGAGGGAIDTQGFTNPSGYNAFQGGFRGPGDLTKLGSGTFFAAATSGGANVSWTGRLIIKQGTWKIVATDGLPYNAPTADGLQPAQVTLDGGTWQMGATINATSGRRGVTIAAGGGTVDTQGFNLTWAGPWAGSITTAVLNKIGSGTLRLNSNATYGPGTYAGILNVNGGTLQLDGGTAMGDLAAINLANTAGVAMSVTGSVGETIGSLAGGGASGGNLSLSASLTTGGNNNSTTFNGLVSGAGGLTKTGSGTFTLTPLSGGNTYGGGTTINGGSLHVNNSTGSGVGGGNVAVNTGGTLGGSGLVGTLADVANVTVNSGGHIAPGGGSGTLAVFGNVSFATGSFFDVELGGLTAGSEFDKLAVNGTAALGGTLNVSLINSFTPAAGNSFEILSATGGINGTTFSNQVLPGLPPGISWQVAYNTNSVVLTAVLDGDFNHDGIVDAADYVVWRDGLGTMYTQAHYDVWRAHFGQAAGSGATLGPSYKIAAPEPATWGVLLLGMLVISFRRCAAAGPASA